MIEKIYEVFCDNCLKIINHYIGNKPTITELREDGAVIKGDKQFCSKKCCDEYGHK